MKTKVSNISPFILLLIPFLFMAIAIFSMRDRIESRDTAIASLPNWKIPNTFQVKTLFFWF